MTLDFPVEMILDAGSVERYHSSKVPKQTVGHHSWGVAIICLILWPDNHNLLKMALLHDAHEKIIGDIPYKMKKRLSGIMDAESTIERQWPYSVRGIHNQEDLQKLACADMLELVSWTYEQLLAGCQFARGMNVYATGILLQMTADNGLPEVADFWAKRKAILDKQAVENV